MNGLLLVFFVLSQIQGHAQATKKYRFQSQLDQFEVLLTGNSATLSGKPVDLTTWKTVLTLLENPIGNECPELPTQADSKVSDGTQTRSFYLQLGIVSDGKNCLNVSGDGLHYFPLHRDFLTGTKQANLSISSPIKVFRDGTKVFELTKLVQEWQPESELPLLSWDFLDRWLKSLQNYSIRFRTHIDLAQGKPKMVIQIGNQSFEFYKVTSVAWALKRPNGKWLEISDDWSFWYDFTPDVYTDHLADSIRIIGDNKMDKSVRLDELNKLEKFYSRNIRNLYHKLILDNQEDLQIQTVAIRRLRSKPTLPTALAMAEYLQSGTQEDFKKMATDVLRVNFPKGPKYDPKSSSTERQKVVQYWSKWRQDQMQKP